MVCIFLFVLPFTKSAQNNGDNRTIHKHAVFWHKAEVTEIFPSQWGLGADFVYRRKSTLDSRNPFETHMRTSIRPWVHYQFSPYARLSLSPVGYMLTDDYVAVPEDLLRDGYHEYRSTLQFFHHLKQLDGRIIHTWRYRYEVRFQSQEDGNYRYFNRFRFRYRIRYLINSSDFYTNGVVFAAFNNELGVNFGKEVPYPFNQNRTYLGVGYRFLNAARIEMRYVRRFRARGSVGNTFDLSNGVMIAINIDQISNLGGKLIPEVKFYD